LFITAEGGAVKNPRHYRKAEKQLAKAQQRLARRKKGSKRREKARVLVAKQLQQVRRQRREVHHTTALMLVRQYDLVALEDLPVADLVCNRHLSTSIGETG